MNTKDETARVIEDLAPEQVVEPTAPTEFEQPAFGFTIGLREFEQKLAVPQGARIQSIVLIDDKVQIVFHAPGEKAQRRLAGWFGWWKKQRKLKK
ncbi:MAG TPA: hypothetical protein PKD09_09445 [Aggregatilinea sp.]|uniref:hypothetical protein n=1 Tax=Aggregatilinea sp. TaxID=2806333 RepID=UPI002BD9DF28|nr:hypothetical protein [Aggregatilinea sp.]HML21861.1 hypothetical protein [Aggregatilinea sp.]